MLTIVARLARVAVVLAAALVPAGAVSALAAEKLTTEEVVARHLEALGPEAARSSKTRKAAGSVKLSVLTAGGGFLNGTSDLVSDGRSLRIAFNLESPDYPGETLVFDGKDLEVADAKPGTRTFFGNFVLAQSPILGEGLMGGVLSTAWPLLDVNARQAKIKYEGLKAIGGRDLHQLRYVPRKGGGDLDIRLFFDPETFRHVRTVYSLTVSTSIGPSEVESARQDVTRVAVEESFDDFQTILGKTLPTRWTVRFTRETKTSLIWEWNVQVLKVTENDPVEASLFKIRR